MSMTIYWMIKQLKRPYHWVRALLLYHFGPGKKVEVSFSGNVPEGLAGKTYMGRVNDGVLTSRTPLNVMPAAGTIVTVIEKGAK